MHNLLCVLDWGLGHASRSLALVAELERLDQTVTLATYGRAQAMIRAERPDLEVYELPPYAVRYPTKSMVWNVAVQAPKWLNTVVKERRETARLVEKLGVDRVISDSRFGCYVPGLPSVFLSHQLHPITPFPPANWLYTRQLQNFTEFWVPDEAGEDRLSGKLSDPEGYQNVRYLGQLSRLSSTVTAREPFDVLALLSGPEPARGQLEEEVIAVLNDLPGQHVIVRGLPGKAAALKSKLGGHVRGRAFVGTGELNQLLRDARTVLCRSGYSSLMDLRKLGKQAILIPTPGQTEQLYLAERAVAQGWARSVSRVAAAFPSSAG